MATTTSPSKLFVIGVDGSKSSIAALRYAREFAEAQGARLRAVAVWSYPISYTPLPTTWVPSEDSAQLLDQATTEVFGTNVPDWYERVVHEGSPAHVLIEESNDADLLIVGSRGHGGFAGLLLGSVSSQCAEHAHCPVLVVH